jgi:hypothetical protein
MSVKKPHTEKRESWRERERERERESIATLPYIQKKESKIDR